MRDYELMFIISPRVSEEETGNVTDRVKQFIANAGGEVTKAEQLGLRRLAYPIRDSREGFYVVLNFRMAPKATTELERNLKLTEDIIRYLLVRLGD